MKFVLYLALTTAILLAAIEFVSLRINRSHAVKLPFFYLSPGKLGKVKAGSKFTLVDPHLGYAHGEGDRLDDLRKRYVWVDGFVIYKTANQEMERPILLTLGGSTTDGVNFKHSWPEYLAKIMADKGQPGTVINGGTGGYSTNQELLKLIRDGLSFHPDIVVSYSGVNDRGTYSVLPYPMVHPHQKKLLEVLTQEFSSRFMPNLLALLSRTMKDPRRSISYTQGVKSELSLAEQYERNIILMNSIARTYGAEFFALIQPNAHWTQRNRESLIFALYSEITNLPKKLEFCRDLTGIFETHEGVYKEDGVHTTDLGDRLIAEEVFKVLSPALEERLKQANRAGESRFDSVANGRSR